MDLCGGLSPALWPARPGSHVLHEDYGSQTKLGPTQLDKHFRPFHVLAFVLFTLGA